VRATSAGEGKGATFIVELPITVAQVPAERGGGDRAAAVDCADLGGLSVLFVDDTLDTREIVKRVLEECKARVRTAGSGEEALALLAEERPDILVSDIGIPGMDGYELIRRVRAMPRERGGDVPAVALTALARAEDRTRALLAGFQTHLAKPVQPTELMAAIGSLVSRAARSAEESGVRE
jgi:CheY-like chemotaxis protein